MSSRRRRAASRDPRARPYAIAAAWRSRRPSVWPVSAMRPPPSCGVWSDSSGAGHGRPSCEQDPPTWAWGSRGGLRTAEQRAVITPMQSKPRARAARLCCGSWVANDGSIPRHSRHSMALARWMASRVLTSCSCVSATSSSSRAPSRRRRSITRQASTLSSSLAYARSQRPRISRGFGCRRRIRRTAAVRSDLAAPHRSCCL